MKGVRETVETIARDLGLRATASAGRAPTDARPLGWTRWLLEQYEFEFENITDADIRKGALRPRFDAIVLPDISAERILNGHAAGAMPPEYVGGIGKEGGEMLRQ